MQYKTISQNLKNGQFIRATGHVVCHENTWRWTVHCYTAKTAWLFDYLVVTIVAQCLSMSESRRCLHFS